MTDRVDRSTATSLRVDWVLAGLAVWLIGGFYIDIWAHAHGRVDDTFFTPWHALLYTGAAAFGVVTGWIAIFGRPRGVPVRDVLPEPYLQSLLGAVLFIVAGGLDLIWHTVFGFEVDIEALLSPTHLLLAASGLLMIGGPLRSAAARIEAGGTMSWRTAGPIVIPLAMASAILVAFTQYANPIVDAWASAITDLSSPPVSQIYSMAADGSGQTRLIVSDRVSSGGQLSPDGSQIVYAARSEPDGEQIRLMSADGTEDHQLTSEGANFRPAWSPDGTSIVFGSRREDGEPDLFVMGIDGSGIRQLTDDQASDWAAAWSPDGAAIAFNSNRSGTFDLYVMAPDGTGQTALTTGPADDFEPAWSPDGTQIAFTSNRGGDDFQIWIMPSDGSVEPVLLQAGDGSAYMPSWSPDGESITFTSNRTGDFEVFVVPAGGGEPTNLSRNPGSDDGWAAPFWSPDGSRILYPVEGNVPFWQVPYIRQGFGAAGVLVAATMLAGIVAFARRRWQLPFGAYTVLVAVPASMATVISDEYRFIPAALFSGIAADLVAWQFPAGRTRAGDAVVAFLVPALFFAGYFATLALAGGIGWTIHLWLGAIPLAGVIGLFLDELGRGRRAAPA